MTELERARKRKRVESTTKAIRTKRGCASIRINNAPISVLDVRPLEAASIYDGTDNRASAAGPGPQLGESPTSLSSSRLAMPLLARGIGGDVDGSNDDNNSNSSSSDSDSDSSESTSSDDESSDSDCSTCTSSSCSDRDSHSDGDSASSSDTRDSWAPDGGRGGLATRVGHGADISVDLDGPERGSDGRGSAGTRTIAERQIYKGTVAVQVDLSGSGRECPVLLVGKGQEEFVRLFRRGDTDGRCLALAHKLGFRLCLNALSAEALRRCDRRRVSRWTLAAELDDDLVRLAGMLGKMID